MKTYKKKSYSKRKLKHGHKKRKQSIHKKKKSIHKKKRSMSKGIRAKTLKRKRSLSRKKKGGWRLDMSNRSISHRVVQPDSTLSMPRDIALAPYSWIGDHQMNE